MACKISSSSDDALLVRAKCQHFKKKHGLVRWICISLSVIKIIKFEDSVLDNILIAEESHENFLIYDISLTLIGPRPLRIRFDKIDGFIRIYDGTRYLTLFGSEKCDATCDRTRYLISLKSSIIHIFSPYFAKIKIDSYDSLPIQKRLTLHNVIILIKSVLNKDKNHYHYKIFLEKCSYQLAKK